MATPGAIAIEKERVAKQAASDFAKLLADVAEIKAMCQSSEARLTRIEQSLASLRPASAAAQSKPPQRA